MLMPCPNCNQVVQQNSPPQRGPANDGSEIWMCLRCNSCVCGTPVSTSLTETLPCYVKHTLEAHPEISKPKTGPTSGHKKNKKWKRK